MLWRRCAGSWCVGVMSFRRFPPSPLRGFYSQNSPGDDDSCHGLSGFFWLLQTSRFAFDFKRHGATTSTSMMHDLPTTRNSDSNERNIRISNNTMPLLSSQLPMIIAFAIAGGTSITCQCHSTLAFDVGGRQRPQTTSLLPPRRPYQHRQRNKQMQYRYSKPSCSFITQILVQMSANNDGNDGDKTTTGKQESNNDVDNEYDPRDSFGRALRGFQSSALKKKIEVGDTVVCKRTIDSLGIYENASYELTSIYDQYFDQDSQTVVKERTKSLVDPITPGRDRYITLFSPTYHTEPVIVVPEEVGLSSVRNELGNAVLLAIPGAFWVVVALGFYNMYHERTGGSFLDAFWGR